MSLHREPPQRLKQEQSGLQELSARSFSKQRLEKNQAAIERAIESLPPVEPSLTWQNMTALGFATALAGTLVWFALTSQPQQELTSKNSTLEHPNAKGLALQEKTVTEYAPGAAEPLALNSPAAKQDAAGPNALPKPSQKEGKFKHMQKAPLRRASNPPSPKQKKKSDPPAATLGQEIQLFQKAKRHFDSHEYNKANNTLRQLAQSFPKHQLGVELSLLQIRTALALSKHDTALTKMQALLSNSPTRPQAQWYKLLGEIQQARNRCGPALIAYSKALKMGLGNRQEKEVRQAVGRCSRDQ